MKLNMKMNTTYLSPSRIVITMLAVSFFIGDIAAAQVKTADAGKSVAAVKNKSNDAKLSAIKVADASKAKVVTQPVGSNIRDLERAIVEGEQLIAKYPDSDFTSTVMFQLVELYAKRSAHDYQNKMAEYDSVLKRFDAGELKTEPAMPRVSYRQSVETGYKILEKYPTAPFNDKIIYRIAICHLEENNLERAKEFFNKLLAEYPKSDYLLESHFRLGEYYFDHRLYAEAVNHYSKLLNNWQNPFFDMALYKLAWAYYNQNDFAKAISTFIYLIDDINMVNKAQNTEILGKTKTDLRKESIEYVAQCFADFGGARKAETFMQQFGEKPYSFDIFMKLADTYQARNFYTESTLTLEAILRLWPLHEQAPELQNKIVENYLRDDEAEKAEAGRENLVKNYGPGSSWLNKYPEGPVRERALLLAEKTLFILATQAQSRAQKEENERLYRLAIDRYGDFLVKFPKSTKADTIQYYQAECYYEIKDFANAGNAYHQVVMNFPKSVFRIDAAYNRILANYEELKSFPQSDTTTFYLADFLGSGETKALRVPNPVYAKALAACNDYVKFLATGEKMPDILMKYSETLFDLAEYDMAQRVYTKITQDYPASHFTLYAYLLKAQCAIQAEQYLDAEKWARTVVEKYPDSTKQVERAHRLINSSRYKYAESFKKRGEFAAAAQEFENLARTSSDSMISELSLVEAALQYEQAGNKEKAIDACERLYLRFPKSPKVDEALFKAAILCEELGNSTRAAQNYLTIVSVREHSPYAAKGVFAAAQCYEKVGLLENALQTYDRYVKNYQNDPSQYLEALGKAGEICFKRKDFKPATDYFQRAVNSYKQFVQDSQPVDAFMAAEAQFMLGEIRFESYRQVNLDPPLDRSLQRKQALFKEVLALYNDAANLQVAEWTTAASHRIGDVFEEFARAFWESPRPQLEEKLMTKYEAQLMERVRPFKERALESYQANVQQADANAIVNQWVDSSRERIQTLSAELGLPQPVTGQPPANGIVPVEHKDEGANNSAQNLNGGHQN
jgi:TolA-binding protein